MKSLLEYINRNKFENKINNIKFDLDEESLSFLDNDFKQLLFENNNVLTYDMITEEKYYSKTHKNNKQKGNRTIWKSKDGDELKMGDHATQRQDRPVEKGGDGGKRISQYEIVNMFRWSWNDIMEMNYDGKLKPFEYQQRKVDAWTIECQCWLNNKNDKDEVEYCGSRPRNMNLWAVWLLEENGSKVDIIIKTIFRGERMNHVAVQERIRIDAKGNIIQRYKQI